jgi:hypothetical protein
MWEMLRGTNFSGGAEMDLRQRRIIMKKTSVKSEAHRYLENAGEFLNKSPIEGDR